MIEVPKCYSRVVIHCKRLIMDVKKDIMHTGQQLCVKATLIYRLLPGGGVAEFVGVWVKLAVQVVIVLGLLLVPRFEERAIEKGNE
jgi:hypothetical protein